MLTLSRLSLLKNLLPQPGILGPVAAIHVPPKFRRKANKHWDPRWRRFRGLRFIKVDLPDFYKDKKPEEMTPDEIRAKMKERGIQPPRVWQEQTFDVSCTPDIFEPYVPPEGDGKMSIVTVGGAKQIATKFGKKSRTYLTIRKIRSFDEDFDLEYFVPEALKTYQDLHTTMATVPLDKDKIAKLVTERAYTEVLDNLDCKTIKWSFTESIEPARVVHGRQTYMIQKDNIFAQLTVRFHTKQVLAVYDRFGRLCHGNALIAKDVLEYVVFEKHLSNEYGTWRIHHKIIPEWMPILPQSTRTFKIQKEPPPPKEEDQKKIESSSTQNVLPPPESSSSSAPQIATT